MAMVDGWFGRIFESDLWGQDQSSVTDMYKAFVWWAEGYKNKILNRNEKLLSSFISRVTLELFESNASNYLLCV